MKARGLQVQQVGPVLALQRRRVVRPNIPADTLGFLEPGPTSETSS